MPRWITIWYFIFIYNIFYYFLKLFLKYKKTDTGWEFIKLSIILLSTYYSFANNNGKYTKYEKS